LSWNPLKAVPEEFVTTIIELLGRFRFILHDEVRMRGHAIFLVSFVALVSAMSMAVIAVAAITSMATAMIFIALATGLVGANTQR